MRRDLPLLGSLLLATGVALAGDTPTIERGASAPAAQVQTKDDGSLGMSILGNQEAPKALVIVPWKTSELGNSLGIVPSLDDSKLPVDKDVFLRALRYYEIRSGEMTRHNAAQPVAAAH